MPVNYPLRDEYIRLANIEREIARFITPDENGDYYTSPHYPDYSDACDKATEAFDNWMSSDEPRVFVISGEDRLATPSEIFDEVDNSLIDPAEVRFRDATRPHILYSLEELS